MTEKQDLPVATLASGCFWCVEADFRKLLGIVQVIFVWKGASVPSCWVTKYCKGVSLFRSSFSMV